jgi:hypothetical protein
LISSLLRDPDDLDLAKLLDSVQQLVDLGLHLRRRGSCAVPIEPGHVLFALQIDLLAGVVVRVAVLADGTPKTTPISPLGPGGFGTSR